MNKETKKQANFRLPGELMDDLKQVSEATNDSQTEIVRKAIEQKLNRIKNGLQKKQQAAAVA